MLYFQARWLLLHQSCTARSFLLSVLKSAADPRSQLGVFTRQLETLESDSQFLGRPLDHPVGLTARQWLENQVRIMTQMHFQISYCPEMTHTSIT